MPSRAMVRSMLRGKKAFSLVEITIALGLVAFSMTVILGMLPIGLQSVRESVSQQGISNIVRQIRGELSQIPFSASNGNAAYSLASLDQQSLYYTREGLRTDAAGTHGYFTARIAVDDAQVPGGDTPTYNSNLQNVKVTISYPLEAPIANRQNEVFSIMVARQGAN